MPYLRDVQGYSTSPEVVAEIKSITDKAKRVLVLLDSDHSSHNVEVGPRHGGGVVGQRWPAEE